MMWRMTAEPMKPAPPVTRSFIFGALLGFGDRIWLWVGSDLVGSDPFVACLLGLIRVVVVAVIPITGRRFLFHGVQDGALEGHTTGCQAVFGYLDLFRGVLPEAHYHQGGAALSADDGGVCYREDRRGVYDHQVEVFTQVIQELGEPGLHQQF